MQMQWNIELWIALVRFFLNANIIFFHNSSIFSKQTHPGWTNTYCLWKNVTMAGSIRIIIQNMPNFLNANYTSIHRGCIKLIKSVSKRIERPFLSPRLLTVLHYVLLLHLLGTSRYVWLFSRAFMLLQSHLVPILHVLVWKSKPPELV